MDKDIKAKWLEELRSGEYAQGRRMLRNRNNCFCCLGVLCDVIGVAWVFKDYSYSAEGRTDYLPFRIEKKAGLTEEEQDALAQMNDDGATFAEIADYIEKNL